MRKKTKPKDFRLAKNGIGCVSITKGWGVKYHNKIIPEKRNKIKRTNSYIKKRPELGRLV